MDTDLIEKSVIPFGMPLDAIHRRLRRAQQGKGVQHPGGLVVHPAGVRPAAIAAHADAAGKPPKPTSAWKACGTTQRGFSGHSVPQAMWDAAHALLTFSPRTRAIRTRCQTPSLLRGLIFGSFGRALSPTHARGRRGQRYRYYVSQSVLKGRRKPMTGGNAHSRSRCVHRTWLPL